MAQDNRPEIVLDGDISPFRQKMREATESLKRFGQEGEQAIGRMGGPLESLRGKFLAISAVLAGGTVFKEAVAQAAAWTQESVDMAAAMDISAAAAGNLKAALASEGVPLGEFTAASQKLAQTLRNDEQALLDFGLSTRDAAGNLRPLTDLTIESIEMLGDYKAGTYRAIAAQAVFGKGFQITGDLAKLNTELIAKYTEKQRELGQVVTEEGVATFKAYEESTKSATATLRALMNTAGNAVMPVLTDLGNWFSTIGPGAVVVIRGAIGGLVAAFMALRNGITVVWEVINAMVVSVAEPIIAISTAVGKAMVGDFSGAAATLKAMPETIKGAWSGAFDEIAKSSEKTRDQIWNLFAEGTPDAKAAGGGTRRANHLVKEDEKKKAAKEQSMLPQWEAELAALKNAYEQENALRQFSKQQELDFWRSKLATAEQGGKDYLALAKRVATLSLEIRRQEAKEAVELEQVKNDGARRVALFAIEQEEQAARFARENGAITKLELLKLEEDFLQRRYEIERQAAEERMLLIENDPTQSPAALERARQAMLEIEERFKLKKSENKNQQGKEEGSWGNFFDGVSGSFGSAVQGMLTKAQTLRQSMLQIFGSIRDAFLQNVVVKPFTEWLAMQMKKLSLFLGFSRAEQASTQATAVQSMATVANQTSAEVGSKGASAAAGAAESVASIPYVGPILAAAAFAATLAMVLGARSNIRSAAGGFDIPKGLNPMTQLHEEEMVLPSKYANMFRAMEEQGGVAGGGQTVINITAMDAKSVRDYFKTNSHTLAPGLRNLARNFTSVKKS